MWALALKLWTNPLARKFAVYAAVGLATLYAARIWGNRQWAEGERKGRVSAAAELARARASITSDLRKTLAAIGAGKEEADEQAAAVPASDLDAALRAISAELAAPGAH